MAGKRQKVIAKPILEEVSATGDGLYAGLRAALHGTLKLPRDTRLTALGGQDYERMLRDDQVHSTFQQRRLAVIASTWSVAPGGDKPLDREAADFLSSQLARIGWDRVTNKMLFGLFYGYAVAEVIWTVEDGRVGIERIAVRNRLRFRFDSDGHLRLLKAGGEPDGILLPPDKFWTFVAGGDHDDETYGLGLGYHLFWPAWFKREGLKSWLQGLDKTARPTAVGKFPTGASSEDIAKLLETLCAMASDTGIAIPESMHVELLQAARSSTADYNTLYARMDAAIAKIVLSQTMTTDSASTGLGSTQGDVHADVKREVIKADADLLNESFNCSVARWLTKWNFPGAAVPFVSRQISDTKALDAASRRDERLANIGFAPTEERVREVYGDGYERVAVPSSGPAAPSFSGCPECGSSDFVQGEKDTVDHLVEAAVAGDGWIKQMQPVLKPLVDAVGAAGNLEVFRDGLIDRLREMDVTTLQETLARASFAARIAGRLGADRENADIVEDPSTNLSEPKKGLLNVLFPGLKKKT